MLWQGLWVSGCELSSPFCSFMRDLWLSGCSLHTVTLPLGAESSLVHILLCLLLSKKWRVLLRCRIVWITAFYWSIEILGSSLLQYSQVLLILVCFRVILQAYDNGTPAKFDTTVAMVQVNRNSNAPRFSPLDYDPIHILETQVLIYNKWWDTIPSLKKSYSNCWMFRFLSHFSNLQRESGVEMQILKYGAPERERRVKFSISKNSFSSIRSISYPSIDAIFDRIATAYQNPTSCGYYNCLTGNCLVWLQG